MQKYEEIVEKTKFYIEQNICNDITIEKIEENMYYSQKQLNRIFSLITGTTLGEYLRWYRLSRTIYDLQYTELSLLDIAIKFGYNSQDGYVRAFRKTFEVSPAEFRKGCRSLDMQGNSHLREIVHRSSHRAIAENLYSIKGIHTWIITRTARLWLNAKINTEGLMPHDFYQLCEAQGLMEKTGKLTDVVTEGGAYLSMREGCPLSWGVEVEPDYDLSGLEGFEVIEVPETQFVVFHYPKYPVEAHGEVVFSAWDAQAQYRPEALGYEWAYDQAPFYETDDNYGYNLLFPIRPIS